MKRFIRTEIRSCYECPNYLINKNTGADQCEIQGYIRIIPDKDGYLIDKDCPLKEDK